MVFFTNSPRNFIIYTAVSLAAALAIWLLVLHHTDNQVDKITKATFGHQTVPSSGTAQRLADCLTAAGADVDKINACRTKHVP